MNRTTKIAATVVGIAVVGALAYTQLPKGGPDAMQGMGHSTMAAADAPASTKAYEAAMASMMKNMMTPPTGKPDLDFVQGMVPHHQGAIDMAKAVLQYGKDPEVKVLAEGVIKAQEGEIAFINDWLGRTDQNALVVAPDSVKANEQAMAAMKTMAVAYSGDADTDFLKSMIPHHQGAIDMAKVALQFAKDPEVLRLAQDIITAQEGEIKVMTDWLAKNGK
jgi:uncharacterized protein (DUF305 family)